MFVFYIWYIKKINISNTLNEKRESQCLSFISGISKNQPRKNEKISNETKKYLTLEKEELKNFV